MTQGRSIKTNKTPFQNFFEPPGNFFSTAFESRNTESQKLLEPS